MSNVFSGLIEFIPLFFIAFVDVENLVSGDFVSMSVFFVYFDLPHNFLLVI